MFQLDWDRSHDDHENSVWEAASPFHDDGSPFVFRISQRLREDKIEFLEASDPEVMICEKAPRVWGSLDLAKAAMQQDAADIVREHSAGDQEQEVAK